MKTMMTIISLKMDIMETTNDFIFIGLETFEQKTGCDYGVIHYSDDSEYKVGMGVYFMKGTGVLTQTSGGNKLRIDKLNTYLLCLE